MINLMLVVCNNVLNGTERYAVDMAKYLPKDKFNVYIATPLHGSLSDILAANGIKELVYDNGKTNYYSFNGLRNLYKLIKKYNIDIIHANAKFQPCIIGKMAGVKLNVETKHGIFYSNAQIKNLSLPRKVYEYIKRYFVDVFIATSENDKETLVKYFRLPERKIKIVYLGIDFEDIKSRSDSIFVLKEKVNKNLFSIGHIGRLTYQKGQEYLIEAFNILNKKYPATSLTIVGSGENETMVSDLIKKYKLEEKVILKGYIKDIYREMANYDVHVLTSRYEGTGYVNLESMALGVPVITPDVGGATNFFKSGYDSLITKREDPFSTAEAIEKLVLDEDLRKELINNAFITVKKYPAERMAKETAELYISCLK